MYACIAACVRVLYCCVDVCPPQKTVYGASVIIFEGIMAFTDKKLLQVCQRHCLLTPLGLVSDDSIQTAYCFKLFQPNFEPPLIDTHLFFNQL